MAYIRKRGAKWYYTIEIGSETRKRKEVPGGATRQEAEAAYARALVSLEVNSGYVEPTKKTVAEFFAEWLSDDVSINTHKNTVRSYRSIFENHIRPAIGDRKLRSIRPQMLQQLLNDVKQNGLARSTVSSICAVLKPNRGGCLRPMPCAISINGVAKPSARATPFIPCATRTPPFCLRRARTWNLFPSV